MKPTTLIGPAGKLQRTLSLGAGPIKLLFHGPPGVGKSELAKSLAGRLVASALEIDRINGCDLGVDRIRELAGTLRHRSMFSEWNVVIIEEIDKVPAVAQALILTMLDEVMPHVAVIATTNEGQGKIPPRLWSRFERYEVGAPTEKEIRQLVMDTGVPDAQVDMIVASASGNVRAAVLDAQSWFRVNKPDPAAATQQLAMLFA
jgi:replication-associated recombination protein RarA